MRRETNTGSKKRVKKMVIEVVFSSPTSEMKAGGKRTQANRKGRITNECKMRLRR
jgi:hypothetical protein